MVVEAVVVVPLIPAVLVAVRVVVVMVLLVLPVQVVKVTPEVLRSLEEAEVVVVVPDLRVQQAESVLEVTGDLV